MERGYALGYALCVEAMHITVGRRWHQENIVWLPIDCLRKVLRPICVVDNPDLRGGQSGRTRGHAVMEGEAPLPGRTKTVGLRSRSLTTAFLPGASWMAMARQLGTSPARGCSWAPSSQAVLC
jgi:hypothetical protein